MRFTLIALASAIATASGELCPDANNLYYKGRSGDYQVYCGIEYWTKTNIDSFSSSSAIACASYVFLCLFMRPNVLTRTAHSSCDAWTAKNPTSPCAFATNPTSPCAFATSSNKCYLKPGDLTADKRSNSGVISVILTRQGH